MQIGILDLTRDLSRNYTSVGDERRRLSYSDKKRVLQIVEARGYNISEKPICEGKIRLTCVRGEEFQTIDLIVE